MRAVAQHSASDVVEPKPFRNAPISVRISAKADVVYKAIGELAGITVVIDPDFKPQKITVELTNVTVQEAFDTIGLQSKTVWRAVTPNIIFVYPKDSR
jgi:general secretion pathway protein D